MPSFLSKVFARKKSEDKEFATPRSLKRTSDPSLLEGKFEAVPSTISPSSLGFPEDVHASDKGKDKEGDKARPFGLKSKLKPQTSPPTSDAPHLTLRLPGTTDENGNSFVASFDPQANELDDAISTRRLTPGETLSLIEACSKAITERGGLETLGVMRPHWYSASPEIQRKLISLFLFSLASKSPETTLAPTTSPLAAFNSELEYTRSVHDIAAVLRWALRHLKLEGSSFGSSPSSDEWAWYHNFYDAERKADYDPQVFTAKLVPGLPSTHTTLLLSILDTISSLAAHAEANGYSGSKLAKYFGFWLLTARRAAGPEDWSSFYTRWEVSGRMLEHLFLSWLRDENTKRPLPRRLQELVAQYPYAVSPDPTTDGLLTRPRFSTRRYDALFVRVEAVYTLGVKIPSLRSPVGIFIDALESKPKPSEGGYIYLWDQVKAAAESDSDDKPLASILSDDTINLFSLVATDPKELNLLGIAGVASSVVTPLSPVTETPISPITNGNGTFTPSRKPTIASSTPQSPKDWAEFSSAGFGETTLSQSFALTIPDKDVEVTVPPVSRKPSKQKQSRNVSPVQPISPASDSKPAPEEPEGPQLVLATAEIVQLDEAFIDFWRDAVVDPISSDWPNFVLGELKHSLTPSPCQDGEKLPLGGPVGWIIIEERIRRTTPPPTPATPQDLLATSGGLRVPAAPLQRTSSPRPSFGEKKSSSLAATLKRFTLFGSSKDDLASEDTNAVVGGSPKKDSISGRRKFGIGKSPKVGELGEGVLTEEPEPQPEVVKRVDVFGKVEKTESEVVAVASTVVGGAVLATAVGGDKERAKVVSNKPANNDVKEDATTKGDGLQAARSPTEEPAPAPPVTSTAEREVPAPVVQDPPQVPGPTDTPEGSNASAPEKSTLEAAEAPEQQVVETEPDALPPAPESVVSHGETPGPQLALDSTEAGLHHAPDVEVLQQPTPEPFDVLSYEAAIEPLDDIDEYSTGDAAVDLDPVPIVQNDPVEVEEVKGSEVVPQPEPRVAESTPKPVVEEKVGEPTVEDVATTKVPPSEAAAPILEQEPESEPSPAQPIVADEAVEEPQSVVTEGTSSLSPNLAASEEPERDEPTPTQPTPSEPEVADVVATPQPGEVVDGSQDPPVVESTLEESTPEPASHPTETEPNPSSEDPTEIQETV